MSLDDAAALRRQAETIKTNNRLSIIAAVLREAPLYIPVVEMALRQAGADLSRVSLEPELPPAKKAKAGSSSARAEVLPKREVYFGMLSGPTLQALLSELEACYTPESLSGLKPSPRKAIPKHGLQCLLEFLTGMRSDSWISSTGQAQGVHLSISDVAEVKLNARKKRARCETPPSLGGRRRLWHCVV